VPLEAVRTWSLRSLRRPSPRCHPARCCSTWTPPVTWHSQTTRAVPRLGWASHPGRGCASASATDADRSAHAAPSARVRFAHQIAREDAPGMQPGSAWRRLALVSAIVGAGVSAYLLVEYLNDRGGICLTGGGCDAVRASAFAYPLGIPMPLFGVAFYFAATWVAWRTTDPAR